jgi:hypothetical protein
LSPHLPDLDFTNPVTLSVQRATGKRDMRTKVAATGDSK